MWPDINRYFPLHPSFRHEQLTLIFYPEALFHQVQIPVQVDNRPANITVGGMSRDLQQFVRGNIAPGKKYRGNTDSESREISGPIKRSANRFVASFLPARPAVR
jgi:hypothetical protein